MTSKFLGCVAVLALVAGCGEVEAEKEADAIEEITPEPATGGDTGKAKTAEPRPAANELTCSYPVKASDTAKTLQARYGKDARVETLDGPEGMEVPGVVLWGDDPKRRVYVNFEDEARTQLGNVEVYEESAWTLAGIKATDTLETLRAANGKPVKFFGFEWDYSGAVIDLGGGRLANLAGGCFAQFGLGYDYEKWEAPDALIGDVEVSSDAKGVNAKMITIYRMGLGFPR